MFFCEMLIYFNYIVIWMRVAVRKFSSEMQLVR